MSASARNTALLFVFFAVIIAAASGAVVWGFLDDPPSFGNGSYQVRSADALESSTTNDFREDLEGIEPGTYRTEGSIATTEHIIGADCYYVLLRFAGNYPS